MPEINHETFYPQRRESLSYEFLCEVMLRLRQERQVTETEPSWYVRYDKANGGPFAQLWFLTRGCSWDRRGECTMCNYGISGEHDAAEMVAYVKSGMESIDRPIHELYVSPSGSLYDEREVPVDARRKILQLANDFPARRFSFETRPDTLTTPAIDELRTLLPSKEIAVGFGLESANQWILDHCVNKPSARDSFASAISRLVGIELYANTSLGSAFLTPSESVEDAANTVEWVLAQGANLALVFPMHVKDCTLLDWLYKCGLFEPPSLWSLIEVLDRIDPSLIQKVNISWYRPDYGSDIEMVASPTTCPKCQEKVLAALDEFRVVSTSSV